MNNENILTFNCSYDNNVSLKIPIYSGDNSDKKKMYNFYNSGLLLLREQKKREIISNLINKNIVDKNKNYIDGGAFLGDTALPLSKNINGLVYAIDPGVINIEIMKELMELNDINNIKLIQKCLNNENEELDYKVGPFGINFNSFYKKGGIGDDILTVQSTSLDNLHVTNEIENIEFIHLDVENLEYYVLLGSTNLINNYNPVIIFEGHKKSQPLNLEKCCKLLKSFNYTIYEIDEDAGAIDDCKNYLAIPENKLNIFNKEFDFFSYITLVPFNIYI